jgi:hypothetical protein
MYTPMSRSIIATAVLALALLAAPIASAGPTYSYLWDTNQCHSDDELYLNQVVRDYGVSRTALEPILPRLRTVSSDLPVLLFVSRSSGQPVAAIMDLRTRGMNWIDVFRQLGIRYDLLFVDLDRDPGPPYRTAWTSWRANPSSPRLTDYQVRDLVQLQVVHRLSSVPVFEVAQTRVRGHSPIVLVTEKYRRTNTAAAGVPPGHGGVPPGHGGVPPGQVKNGVPPGHRGVVAGQAQGKSKVRAQRVTAQATPQATGKAKSKSQGQGKGKSESKGKGHGHGKK